MKKYTRLLFILALCGMVFAAHAATNAAPGKSSGVLPKRGEDAAKAISMVTGVAISPLLGVGVVGAWEWFSVKSDERARLPWFASPWFWVPALLIVLAIGVKDLAGTGLPPGVKKPIDALEVVENKISGLIAAGAFVPLVASIFSSPSGDGGAVSAGLGQLALSWAGGLGLAAIDGSALWNLLAVPLALVAFLFVWLASHAINILILISPFGVVDAALKSFRLFLMSLLAGVTFVNPYAGAVFALVIIVAAYFLAGWAMRLSVFGSVYIWDFLTLRRRRFTPSPQANWMFLSRAVDSAPIRTYGQLSREPEGRLVFAYRPWLLLPRRTLTLPPGNYTVGRGLFYPEILSLEAERKTRTIFILPPRYRTHEDEIKECCRFSEVRDVGLLRGLKAIWAWTKGLFGFRTAPRPV